MIENTQLTYESDYELLAQAAIERHYLIPYPNAPEKRPRGINRKFHGGTHAARTALNAEMLLALYEKYAPALVRGPNGEKIDLKLLKLAALYHDSANTSEIQGDKDKHSENFINDMLALGYNFMAILPYAEAIAGKDAHSRNFLQKIVHDADCLDIIRVAGDDFNKNYLDCIHDLADKPGFKADTETIISNHKKLIQAIEENPAVHLACENSPYCSQAVQGVMKQLFLSEMVISAMQQGVILDMADLDSIDFSLLNTYLRQDSACFQQLIEKHASEAPPEEDKRDVQAVYRETGCLVRLLSGTALHHEMHVLERNEAALAEDAIYSFIQYRSRGWRLTEKKDLHTAF